MKPLNIKYHLNLIAEKQVQDIKGFYTHFFATFLILPFLIFINLQTVPQFHWFWYAIVAWCIGLIIHWISVFAFSKMGLKEEWKEKRIKKIINSDHNQDIKDEDYLQEKYYLKAKKQAEEIKGFYIHLMVNIFSFPLILFVNLKFVPDFHFFWFALGGMLIALFFHWLGVFGFEVLGLGKQWEEKKRNEIIQKYQ
jgi:hypothetical protein